MEKQLKMIDVSFFKTKQNKKKNHRDNSNSNESRTEKDPFT